MSLVQYHVQYERLYSGPADEHHDGLGTKVALSKVECSCLHDLLHKACWQYWLCVLYFEWPKLYNYKRRPFFIEYIWALQQ